MDMGAEGEAALAKSKHSLRSDSGATQVAANDEQGRLALCKYVLRPPLANDRLKILDDNVGLAVLRLQQT
jgi:hypothetical protein